MGILAASGVAAAGFGGMAVADEPPAALAPSGEIALPLKVRVTAVPGLMEGDASMDGQTNIVDAMFIAQQTVGLRTLDAYEIECADTNDDGEVNIVDAMLIAQFTVDPTQDGGILFKPLWEEPADNDMLDPLDFPGTS